MTPKRKFFITLWSALLASTPAAGRLQAQRVGFSAAAITGQPRSTLLFNGIREATSGIWAGGSMELRIGPVSAGGLGLRGRLWQTGNAFAVTRDAGEVRGWLGIAPASWLAFEADYADRAFSSAAGYQRWHILGVGLRLSNQLGHPALQAHARGAYLPFVKVSGQPDTRLGVAAEVGITALPNRSPLMVQIHYRLERYDFAGSTGRTEQFDAVAIQLGFRVGKAGS